MLFAHQVRAQLGKLTLPEVREALEQLLANDESKNRISQEFELFIVPDAGSSRGLLSLLFASLRSVSQSLLEKFHPRKAVVQSLLQSRNVPWLRHEESTVHLVPTSVAFPYL